MKHIKRRMEMKKALAVATTLVALGSVPACATDVSGSASGIFVNPQPAGATTIGIGTSDIKYGVGFGGSLPNDLTFAGTAFASPFETPFTIGTLSYFNGTTFQGTEPGAVDLAVTITFTAPNSLGAVLSTFTLSLNSTPNNGTPDQNADFIFFPSSFSTNVFDIGGTSYRVKLLGFDHIVGDGFLASNSNELHVREGSRATADLLAQVTSQAPAVPEPSTWAMMLLGFASIGFMAYRQESKPAPPVT